MEFAEAIRKELSKELPGSEFQNRLAPGHTRPFPGQKVKAEAAVCLIILAGKSGNEIILTKRTTYDGHHSGQVSFPGGKREQADKSLIDTAIRESFEETGIKPSREGYLGKLTPLLIPVSGFLVHPYVFIYRYTDEITFNIDRKEVEYIILSDLKQLVKKSLIKKTTLRLDKSYYIITPYYAIKNEIVWGATAMILSEFVEILIRILKKNPRILS
ncbi:MAG: CoA pyrophosphatase [Bacteroidales bacterium]|jgi:8-oxo-dGTP pyrophosphatase MutT (NUDIX family)